MNTIYEQIGFKINDLRTNYGGKGISQEFLAKGVGTTANTISRWEKAVYKPSVEDLYNISKFFGVSVSVFYPEMTLNPKQADLLSATEGLDNTAMDALIEYAKFLIIRKINLTK